VTADGRIDPIARKEVRFYFAYNSPYAFLANTRLEAQLAPFGAEVEYKPVYSPRTGGPPDVNAPRLRYIFEDVGRFAKAYGLVLRPGPFADSRRACIGRFVAREEKRGRQYHDGVYAARWLEGKDIGQDETLAEIAERAGLERRI
jgi:2-hydroxychromene-2-carboxylate isomerase